MQKIVLIENCHLTHKSMNACWCCSLCIHCVPSPFLADCGVFQSCAGAAQSTQQRISIPQPLCFAALAPWAAHGPCLSWQAALRRGRLFQHKICAWPDCQALAGSRGWLHGGLTYAGDAGCATGYEPPATAASQAGMMPWKSWK